MNVIARPKMKRKATPTATAIPALAPIGNESELNGMAVELGLEVWLAAAAAAVAEVTVVEDDVDDDEVEVVEVELVVMAEPAVEEWATNVPVSALGAGAENVSLVGRLQFTWRFITVQQAQRPVVAL
jgi:hypothetical protein